MTTAYVTHPDYAVHTLHGHPEHAGRIKAVWQALADAGLTERMLAVEPRPATDAMVLQVHSPELLQMLRWVAGQERIAMIDADTYALPRSAEIALLAAGGLVQAIEAVLSGRANNGLAVVRPPGHHATRRSAMGFCLISNIALAARHACRQHKLERVLIVDYDVHHGNGTQDIFYDDEQVLFISTHQYPFYPGSGAVEETGSGPGKGLTLNVPLPAGCGDAAYTTVFEQIIRPAVQRFRPQLVLVSAGFDAHWKDPLAMMRLSHVGYDHISRELISLADELCEGRIVFVMEGGYDLLALAHGVRNLAHALLGDAELSDPYGLPPQREEPDITELIARIRSLHGL